MRLTERCREVLRLLVVARWLTTRQLHRRFFGPTTLDAARKRLHKLAIGGYLEKLQPNRMQDALFTLGPEGKRLLEASGVPALALHRQPPKQLEHFLGVNDLRIAAELSLPLSYFFAYWELPGLRWDHPVIPDAVFAAEQHTFAVEFDRGMESVRYFLRTKPALYERGLGRLSVHRVLVVTDRWPRLEVLANAIGGRANFIFTTLDLVREQGLRAAIFFETAHGQGVKLL